jgi:hypothetical protein
LSKELQCGRNSQTFGSQIFQNKTEHKKKNKRKLLLQNISARKQKTLAIILKIISTSILKCQHIVPEAHTPYVHPLVETTSSSKKKRKRRYVEKLREEIFIYSHNIHKNFFAQSMNALNV